MIETTDLHSPLIEEATKSYEFWAELAIMDFSRGVRKMLKRRGLNQKELAEALGHSESYISQALGKENITIRQMQKILDPLRAAIRIVVTDRDSSLRCREVPRRLGSAHPQAVTEFTNPAVISHGFTLAHIPQSGTTARI